MIHAWFANELLEADQVDGLIEQLVARGVISISGDKVSYET
jgi:hypothetical protein